MTQSIKCGGNGDGEENKPRIEPVRRNYSKPVLIVHGTLRDITHSVGSKGKPDGGTKPGKTKTIATAGAGG
jgi:hypothetical protein